MKAIQQSEGDPLTEPETLLDYGAYLVGGGVSEEEHKRRLALLEIPGCGSVFVGHTGFSLVAMVSDLVEEDVVPVARPDRDDGVLYGRTDNRIQGRSEALELEEGSRVSVSGERRVLTLHQLGACYMIPGVNYMDSAWKAGSCPLPHF